MRKFSTQNSDIYLGDCLDILKEIQDGSIGLIVTSPPYADQRSNTYGGIHPDKYIEWFFTKSKRIPKSFKAYGFFYSQYKRTCLQW